MQTYTLTGAHIVIYINNKVYSNVKSITLNVEYEETAIHGIDSPWAQEIASNKVSVSGSVQGMRVKQSGGLQGSNLRPLFTDIADSPYVSIRIHDRQSGEDIVLIDKAKVTNEKHSIAARNIYNLSFDFVGVQPLFALDRA